MAKKLIITTFGIFLVACATSESGYRRSTEADGSGSTAHGSAYAAEGFAINKKQPVRSQNDYEFYYKRCELGSDRAYYSKTSYECSESPR